MLGAICVLYRPNKYSPAGCQSKRHTRADMPIDGLLLLCLWTCNTDSLFYFCLTQYWSLIVCASFLHFSLHCFFFGNHWSLAKQMYTTIVVVVARLNKSWTMRFSSRRGIRHCQVRYGHSVDGSRKARYDHEVHHPSGDGRYRGNLRTCCCSPRRQRHQGTTRLHSIPVSGAVMNSQAICQ